MTQVNALKMKILTRPYRKQSKPGMYNTSKPSMAEKLPASRASRDQFIQNGILMTNSAKFAMRLSLSDTLAAASTNIAPMYALDYTRNVITLKRTLILTPTLKQRNPLTTTHWRRSVLKSRTRSKSRDPWLKNRRRLKRRRKKPTSSEGLSTWMWMVTQSQVKFVKWVNI